MSCVSMSLCPLIPSRFPEENGPKSITIKPLLPRNRKIATAVSCTGSDNSSQNTATNQQLNLSVLRFTFGIPGFDESYLPRWIGYAFGSLLLLNHFVGSDSSAITPAQLRTEVLGLFLAAFSAVVPYLGKFLKGATPFSEKSIPDDAEQIFLLSPSISDALKEDLAWASYSLLRHTNTTSVLISVEGAICVRGYWNKMENLSKDSIEELFEQWTQQIGLSKLTDELYFPQAPDLQAWGMLPKGTRSILVQPVLQTQNMIPFETEKNDGFVLLASCSNYAYSNKDRSWIGAVAKKFRGRKSHEREE